MILFRTVFLILFSVFPVFFPILHSPFPLLIVSPDEYRLGWISPRLFFDEYRAVAEVFVRGTLFYSIVVDLNDSYSCRCTDLKKKIKNWIFLKSRWLFNSPKHSGVGFIFTKPQSFHSFRRHRHQDIFAGRSIKMYREKQNPTNARTFFIVIVV